MALENPNKIKNEAEANNKQVIINEILTFKECTDKTVSSSKVIMEWKWKLSHQETEALWWNFPVCT